MTVSNGKHEESNIDRIAREFGQKIAEARKRQGLTEAEVATMVGCSRPTVQNAEAGAIKSRSTMLTAIADLFDLVVPDELPSPEERKQMNIDIARTARQQKRGTVQMKPTEAPAAPRGNGLWKVGPAPEDWEGMTEGEAQWVHATARKDGFDPGPRPFMAHPLTNVYRVSVMDPSKQRDRIEVKSFSEYDAWRQSPTPVSTTVPATVAPEPSPASPAADSPQAAPTAPSIVWEAYTRNPGGSLVGGATVSVSPGGQVYFNRAAVAAHEHTLKATWFKGTVDGRVVVGIKFHSTGEYKVDRVPSSPDKPWSGLSVNGAKFFKSLGVRPAVKTWYRVQQDEANGIVWFDPACPIQ